MGSALVAAVVSVAGGLCLWLAFPPYGVWALAAGGPLALALATRGRSAGRGAVLGLLLGLAFMVPLLQWTGTFVGDLPWLALSVLQAGFCAVLGAATALTSRLRWSPLWAAALWVAMEAARSRVPFGGFPWGRIGFSQADGPLASLAAYGGVASVTFAVALTGTLLAAGIARAARRRGAPVRLQLRAGAPPVVAALLVPAAGTVLWLPLPGDSLTAGGRPATIAVIQGDVPAAGLGFNERRRAVLDNHARQTVALAGRVATGASPRPDLVVWPENSSDIDPYRNADAAAAIDTAARAIAVPILVGAVLDGPGENLTNAGIVWDPESGPGARYAKRHPVPFGEYMPLRSFFRFFSDQVDLLRRDFVAGQRPGVLDIGGVRIGDVICFEVAYDGLVSDVVEGGASVLVVQTNNATFGYTAESEQQLAMSRLRAIEHGRSVLVAATSGISAVVAPDGTVVERSELFTPDVFVEPIAQRQGITVATRLGAVPEWALAGVGLAAVLGAVLARRSGPVRSFRRRTEPRPPVEGSR
ncbi:apolipoprotein N-acyltransferase [Geodermatophilus aquaeductus]|uniref:Apolipoprotein N-acyltransferase n=1 Tax=Geodermatophilus aquaeductus TaxID=1564161 RepID=A0A521FJA6_9ACTN|nr:apolipoprotein N-acyltransferase [Geodermatophilus aquaeductus]SMO96287.1 apolipoprotein N-acyltransferase [Geodermatophilus aquaeductus]